MSIRHSCTYVFVTGILQVVCEEQETNKDSPCVEVIYSNLHGFIAITTILKGHLR